MDDDDYPMEDDVLASTELNGDTLNGTIDPAKLGFDNSVPSRNDQLPFHSPSKTAALSRTNDQLKAFSSYPGPSQSDKMDLAQTTPTRRTSPEVRIAPKPRVAALPYASSRTGLVYDPRMRFHAELASMSVNEDDIHPEDPRRIHAIFEEIREAGLVGSSSTPEDEALEAHCWRIALRSASKHEILLIHTEEHYAFVESLQTMSLEQLKFEAERLDSIYFNHSTYECAKLAAGGAIEACKAVVQGAVRNAIAIIRPPGHHAESTQPSGFCIFNNVPIATRVCQEAYPEVCRKVLILDWDVHHGNGIQHAFYDDPNVLYISLHVYRDGNFYPNLPDGNLDYCGEGAGEGKNVNIPWADHGMGDAEYLYAFQEIVMPIATEFNPDLVIISAGFDAAEGDLLGGCFVTPACYGHMTHMLMRLAKGKLVVCLEGGYNLRSIARSALAVTRVLMLEPPDRLQDNLSPKDSAVHTIDQVKRQHSKFWKCLYPKHMDKTDPGFQDMYRLHEIIREWQSQRLSLEHAMTPLPLQINKAGLTQTFDHNVIATPHFMERHPLLVIFHDPPNFRDNPDPVTGKRELHNTWLTDVTKKYIDWAIDNGFQVVDVNIPRIVAVEDPDEAYVRSDDSAARAEQTRELAVYIWENYIEPNEATQVFFMGIGDAYLGLVDLLSRYENCTDHDSVVECLIGFVAETTIQSIKRTTDDTIADWYHRHSKIFVKNSHFVWDPSRQRKLRRKLGNLIKSPQDSLDTMLEEHQKEVQDLLLERRSEYEEMNDVSSRTDDQVQTALRSPPLFGGPFTPNSRQESMTKAVKSPILPPVGIFSMPSHSPRSPRSPLKKTY
ncbi:putative histone deacetylase [Paraphoma chrysanthemicola]|uniref:Histone deacetylase n=1 Tax=Paraphoma chrysanthemicola TaxID=798071 RepID=A0A8K0RAA3_9PLEO|nr:putative histone deacetylase [Paraphoma chrysanthemicola]